MGTVTVPQETAFLPELTPVPASAGQEGGGMTVLQVTSGAAALNTTTTTTATTQGVGAVGGSTETHTGGGTDGSGMWERVTSDYGLTSPWPWLFLLVALMAALAWMWLRRVRERWIRQRWA